VEVGIILRFLNAMGCSSDIFTTINLLFISSTIKIIELTNKKKRLTIRVYSRRYPKPLTGTNEGQLCLQNTHKNTNNQIIAKSYTITIEMKSQMIMNYKHTG
jgi:hypothetical protein